MLTVGKDGEKIQQPIKFCVKYSVVSDRRADDINGTGHHHKWERDCMYIFVLVLITRIFWTFSALIV